VQPQSAGQAIAAPSDIKLSGIAWQEERRARRAVVNGFLMQEGGLVSGARITDIFQDRVRFSLSGKSFEIPLISSPVPAAGK
jgi:general secretion pathway protein B